MLRLRSLLFVAVLAASCHFSAAQYYLFSLPRLCDASNPSTTIGEDFRCSVGFDVSGVVDTAYAARLDESSKGKFDVTLTLTFLEGDVAATIVWLVDASPPATSTQLLVGDELIIRLTAQDLAYRPGFALFISSETNLAKVWLTVMTSPPTGSVQLNTDDAATVRKLFTDCCPKDEVACQQFLEIDKKNASEGFGGLCASNATTCNSDGRLVQLHLPSVGLSCDLPDYIANLTELQSLVMPNNAITGKFADIAAKLKPLKQLGYLTLRGNSVSGSLDCDSLAALSKLTALDVSDNQLTGSIPQCFIDNLQIMSAGDNGLKGTIPKPGSSSHLTALLVSNNSLTGSIPDMTGASGLNTLWLQTNKLTGDLPSLPSRIRQIDMSHNSVGGKLPDDYGKESNLTSLLVANNNLQGTIPTSIQTSTTLRFIDMSHNQLTGALGSAWSADTLYSLDVSSNKLTGSLSSSLAALPVLSYLNVTDNKLSGSLDEFASKLDGAINQILILSLSSNAFSGTIPAGFQNLSMFIPYTNPLVLVVGLLDLTSTQLSGTYPDWMLEALEVTGTIVVSSKNNLACPAVFPNATSVNLVSMQRRLSLSQCVTSNGQISSLAAVYATTLANGGKAQQEAAGATPPSSGGKKKGGVSSGVAAAVGIVIALAVIAIAVAIFVGVRYRENIRRYWENRRTRYHDFEAQGGNNPTAL